MTESEIKAEVLRLLEEVLDPEVPALSIVDLGIVRDVSAGQNGVTVRITPTYSGCPAMEMIASGIESRLHQAGYQEVNIETVLSPPWSSAWMSARGREKLRAYGIAPPQEGGSLVGINPKVPCPFCDSKETELKSRFGATACKALYFCRACKQPFEYFKEF